MTNDPAASYNVSVDCGAAYDYKVGLNYEGSMTCPGDSHGSLVYECPGRRERPICAYWDGSSYVQDPTCIVHTYDNYETVCVCNHLALEVNGGKIKITAFFVPFSSPIFFLLFTHICSSFVQVEKSLVEDISA